MTKRLVQRLMDDRRASRAGPVVCRICGGTLGHARAVLHDGRVHLEGFEGWDRSVRVRWTGEDELSFEHVHAAECRR